MSVRVGASAGIAVALLGLPACGKSTDVPASDRPTVLDPAATATAESAATPEGGPPPTSPPKSLAKSTHVLMPAPSPSVPLEAPRPLAAWMRGPATAAFDSGDLEAIATSFERMTPWAPSGYANWVSIARDGAVAARAGSMEGVKAACRGCHTEYRAPYMATFSTRPLS